MKTLGLFFFLAATHAFAFSQDPTDQIIGGSTVAGNDPIASSTVLLVGSVADASTGKKSQYICSGSIIDTDLVVTAAHCVAENPKAPTAVGDIRIIFATKIPKSQSDSSVHTISGYEANPSWTGNVQGAGVHDIAVVRFNGAIPSGYGPVDILGTASGLKVGAPVTLAGYGITSPRDQTGKSAGTLRKVNTTISKLDGSTEVEVDETKNKGACNGDSGGPAFLSVNGKLELWGVTSRGDQNCKVASIYTRVDAYTSFIDQAARSLRARN